MAHLKKSIESKWKTVETEIGACFKVKVIANKKNKLDKNQIYMKINRSENSHGLIRNIVYFKGKDNQVVNSKIVLQYYIDRKLCDDTEEVEYIASSHGNIKSQKSFHTIKKSVLSNFKSQLLHKGKRTASILYDNSHQNGSDNRDFGDLPRSKKQLTDLQQLPSAENEVGDILTYNEELPILKKKNPLLWYQGDILSDLWVCILNKVVSNHTEHGATSKS